MSAPSNQFRGSTMSTWKRIGSRRFSQSGPSDRRTRLAHAVGTTLLVITLIIYPNESRQWLCCEAWPEHGEYCRLSLQRGKINCFVSRGRYRIPTSPEAAERLSTI